MHPQSSTKYQCEASLSSAAQACAAISIATSEPYGLLVTSKLADTLKLDFDFCFSAFSVLLNALSVLSMHGLLQLLRSAVIFVYDWFHVGCKTEVGKGSETSRDFSTQHPPTLAVTQLILELTDSAVTKTESSRMYEDSPDGVDFVLPQLYGYIYINRIQSTHFMYSGSGWGVSRY